MSNPNANVRKFDGAVNAAAYWIYDHLLRAGDIVNDSNVTGATVKAALNTLSTASTAVFPFVAAGLAEQDLVSYDAGAATWRNRTKVAALKGTGTNSFVVGSGSLAAGTNDIILGTSAGNASNTGNNNIGIGTDVLDGATAAVNNVVAIGNGTMSGALGFAASYSIGIGTGTLGALSTGPSNVAVGAFNQITIQSGSGNTSMGSYALSHVSTANTVSNCVAIGESSLGGALTNAVNGACAVGRACALSLTSGAKMAAFGFQAGQSVATGSRLSLFGYSANSASGADDNTFIGDEVGNSSVGSRNTAVGSQAFNSASAAVTDCVAMGYNALTGALTAAASGSIGIGSSALAAQTTGTNTAVGYQNQMVVTTGTNNASFGYAAMSSSSMAVATSGCVAFGASALTGALTVAANGAVALGFGALVANTSGAHNTHVGFNGTSTVATTTGSDCTFVGYGVTSAATASNNTIVGSVATAATFNGCTILGTNATATANNQFVVRLGNSSTTELTTDLAVTAGVAVAIGAEPYFTIIIGGNPYKVALRS